MIVDISNQTKKLSVVISTDATNYYDRIAHPYVSKSFQYFRVQLEYLLLLFTTT